MFPRSCLTQTVAATELVLCGDFLQLPPVTNASRPFAFQGAAWGRAGLDAGTIHLRTPHRQASDPAFVEMLGLLRRGVCSASTSAQLAACHIGTKPQPRDGIVPTKLYCTNKDVDAENAQRLAELSGRSFLFPAHDTYKGTGGSKQTEEQLCNTLGKKIAGDLELKVGAQVVLLRNLSDRLANGSRGVVVGFVGGAGGDDGGGQHYNSIAAKMAMQQYRQSLRPQVQFDCGITQTIDIFEYFQGSGSGSLSRWQVPLKLGWALTVHRAQGMTLSRVELQIDGAFAPGQAYVALSRATGLAGLWLHSHLRAEDVRADPAVLSFYGLQ